MSVTISGWGVDFTAFSPEMLADLDAGEARRQAATHSHPCVCEHCCIVTQIVTKAREAQALTMDAQPSPTGKDKNA